MISRLVVDRRLVPAGGGCQRAPTFCVHAVDIEPRHRIDCRRMRVVVIGAGIVGLTSARFLQSAGIRDLVVVDRAAGPAGGTSFANGALLHPSAVEPWNSPGILGYLLRHLGRDDAAVLLRARALPSLLGWGLRFLRESSPARFRANALANTALALHSLHRMREIGIEPSRFDHAARGSVTVLRNSQALDAACEWAEELASVGVRCRLLDRPALLTLEPSLAPVADRLTGAIHNLDDETGDCQRYCEALVTDIVAHGAETRWNAEVDGIDIGRQGARAVRLRDGSRIGADALVLAAGPQSAALARPLGLRLPIRPAKGYSLTYTLGPESSSPRVPVIDRSLHVAVTPLGTGTTRRLRVAGTAEFCGNDLRIVPERVANLAHLARQLYPQVVDAAAPPRSWTGLRPMCADGRPLVGPTRLSGLWLNTGHGHLGWTVGAASGQLLAAQMVGDPSAARQANPFAPARFGL